MACWWQSGLSWWLWRSCNCWWSDVSFFLSVFFSLSVYFSVSLNTKKLNSWLYDDDNVEVKYFITNVIMSILSNSNNMLQYTYAYFTYSTLRWMHLEVVGYAMVVWKAFNWDLMALQLHLHLHLHWLIDFY